MEGAGAQGLNLSAVGNCRLTDSPNSQTFIQTHVLLFGPRDTLMIATASRCSLSSRMYRENKDRRAEDHKGDDQVAMQFRITGLGPGCCKTFAEQIPLAERVRNQAARQGRFTSIPATRRPHGLRARTAPG